jgi:toxin-antitoxin system PIN domain toxin
MTPDVNLLVAAMRLDHPHHVLAFAHLQAQLQQSAKRPIHPNVVLLGSVVSGFIRIVTNAQIFFKPSSLQQAMDFVDALLISPGVAFQAAGSQWPGFRDICLQDAVTSNLVSDAWIAASALQLGEVVHTFDRDFKKLLPADNLYLLSR